MVSSNSQRLGMNINDNINHVILRCYRLIDRKTGFKTSYHVSKIKFSMGIDVT